MSEYDLKKSEKIGQLYPVLVDVEGNVIDGFHRLEADPNWRTEKLPAINTREKLLVARCVSNWHRRQVSGEEKEEWINGLAKIYKDQGFEVGRARQPNQIVNKIVEVTGLTSQTVRRYLSKEFRQVPPENLAELNVPRLSASERIEHELGREYVERHKEEVEQELRPRMEREIREDLTRDADFIREAIEKAPEVFPTLPDQTIERAKKAIKPLTKEMAVKKGTIYTVGEYECPNCKRHYWIRCNGRRDWVE